MKYNLPFIVYNNQNEFFVSGFLPLFETLIKFLSIETETKVDYI